MAEGDAGQLWLKGTLVSWLSFSQDMSQLVDAKTSAPRYRRSSATRHGQGH